MKLYFATGNAEKFQEVKEMLESSNIELLQAKLDIPELQGTPTEVAKEKARMAFEQLKEPVFVDDTGLAFTALNGMPGIYIKHFLKAIGHAGLNNLLANYEDKSATAFVTIGFCDGKTTECVKGECKGKIVPPQIGERNFGWDPIFAPDGFEGKSFDVLGIEIKNKISHRAKAINNFSVWLKDYLNQ